MTESLFQKVLVADDMEENRRAALIGIPCANVLSNASDAIRELRQNEYDLLITDISMETPWAGLDVVAEALSKGVIPYTFSVISPGHHGEIIELNPGYHGKFEGSKGNPELWRRAYESICRNEGIAGSYHRTIRKLKEHGPISIERNTIFVVYSHQPECLPWINMGGETR